MCAPFGRKKQLPGLNSWKKNSSWSCSAHQHIIIITQFFVQHQLSQYQELRAMCNIMLHNTVIMYLSEYCKSNPAKFSVITFGSLLLYLLPFFQLFWVRKWDAIDSLQSLCFCLPFPVSWRVLAETIHKQQYCKNIITLYHYDGQYNIDICSFSVTSLLNIHQAGYAGYHIIESFKVHWHIVWYKWPVSHTYNAYVMHCTSATAIWECICRMDPGVAAVKNVTHYGPDIIYF